MRGNALSGLRRWPEAAVAFRECIRIAWGAVCMHDLAYGLWNLPRALAHLRQPEAALQLSAFAAQFWTTHFGPLSQSDERELMRVRRLAACQLDAARCEALWTQGQRLATAQAVRLALGEAC